MNSISHPINIDMISAMLQAIRYTRPLPKSNTLQRYLEDQQIISDDLPSQLQDYYVALWLSDMITGHYNRHRAYHGLSELHPNTPKQELVVHLIGDYRFSYPQLEAWSVIFIRYVCLTARISNQKHAQLASTSQRTLRRRQQLGIQQLYVQLLIGD